MSDIVDRLRSLESLKPGDPYPEWLPEMNWGPAISQLAGEAAHEIERLRTRIDALESDPGTPYP